MLSYSEFRLQESGDAVQRVQDLFGQFRQQVDPHLSGVGIGDRVKGGIINATRSLANRNAGSIAGALPSRDDVADPQKLRSMGLGSTLGRAGLAGLKGVGNRIRRGIVGEMTEAKADGLDAIDALQSGVTDLVKKLSDENAELRKQVGSTDIHQSGSTLTPGMSNFGATSLSAEPSPQAVYSVMSELPPDKMQDPLVSQVVEKLKEKKTLTVIAKEMGMSLPALKKRLSAIDPEIEGVLDGFKGKKPSTDYSAFDRFKKPFGRTV